MKALTREDLLRILEEIFRLSRQEDNAFAMLPDGLYVKNLEPTLQEHTDDIDIHVSKDQKVFIDKFSLGEDGTLLYDGVEVLLKISGFEGNGLVLKEDGLYVRDYATEMDDHIKNGDIHVTLDDKKNWNKVLQDAKDYMTEELKKLVIYDMTVVKELPTEEISPTTLYLFKEEDTVEECGYTRYMYINDEWVTFGVTNKTLKLYATKKELEDYVQKKDSHEHDNLDALKEFSLDENGKLLYKGKDVQAVNVSQEEGNAIQQKADGWYIPDYSNTIKQLQIASALTKDVLLKQECSTCGVYELKDSIDKYNMLLVEYYWKPDDEEESPGCAKTAILDPITMEELYQKGIDYMLELGHGISVSNSKIHMSGNKLWVNYYHNICIYKISGIRRGDDNE